MESVSYTFENGNLIGIGFWDNETDNLVQFRGAVSNSAALTITLDAGNNALVFDFDDEALVLDIPDATTTQRGILETATNAEALAKAATDKIVTPSNFAAMGSTTTFAGLVELATDAETIAGVSTTLAVTPAGLAAVGATNTTTTFIDAVARAAAIPTFAGQFGTQLDTDQAYVATGVSAGNWAPLLTFGVTNLAGGVNTTINSIGITTFSGSGVGRIVFTAVDEITVTSLSTFTIDTGSFFNIETGSVFQMGGASAPANSVLTTGAAGELTTTLQSDFLSVQNTQTGYTNFANPAVLRTCDTTTVTLPQLAQIVGTLINDLKATLLPAT